MGPGHIDLLAQQAAVTHFLDKTTQIEISHLNVLAPGRVRCAAVQLRKVKDVIHELEQAVSTRLDRFQIEALQPVQTRV